MADDAAAPEGELTESSGTELTESPDEATESPQADTSDIEDDATDDGTAADGVPDADGEPAEEPAGSDGDEDSAEVASDPAPLREPMHPVRLALVIGVTLAVALAALTGWLGWRAYESHQADKQRELFLQMGRQAAINLTTIDADNVDTQVQRILDTATDSFYDDFSKRSKPFAEVVRQVKSKTSGEVTAAGLETMEGDQANVLVAITVKTANAGAPEAAPRMWRMRITLKQTGPDEVKVSNVGFVP